MYYCQPRVSSKEKALREEYYHLLRKWYPYFMEAYSSKVISRFVKRTGYHKKDVLKRGLSKGYCVSLINDAVRISG